MTKMLAGPTPLSKALREARKLRKWSQRELAERSGIGERTVRELEAGRGSIATYGKAISAMELVICYRNAASLTIPQVIRTLRERRELSQRDLARIAGVSQPTISTLERGEAGQIAPMEKVLIGLGAGAYLAPEGQAKSFYATAGNSSVGQTWETPKELLETLYATFRRFDLDPASPSRRGPVKARIRYTIDDDGLSLPWKGRVFVNPPYGRGLSAWVEKAKTEFERGNAQLVILLIPARTDTAYFHDFIDGHAEVVFLRKRLRFGGMKQSAPFPSALAIYGSTRDELGTLCEALGVKGRERWK